jgi:ATP-binding cassette subfamily B multidrug efflux pump
MSGLPTSSNQAIFVAKMSPTRRLLAYMFRYRSDFLVGLVFVVITTAISLASPIVLQHAIDDLTQGVTRAKLVEYGALLLLIGIAGGLFRFLMRRVLIGASRHLEYDIRNDFFAHLERLPPAYFQRHRTGDLMSRATNDLNAVRMMIGPSVMYSADTVLRFVVAIAVMLSIDWRLTLWSLIPLPFVSIAVKYFGGAIHKRFEQIQAQLADLSAVVQEALSGVRVVRAYGREAYELERFRQSNDAYVARNRGLITLQGFFFPSMAFFLGLGALVALWFGSREVINGRITIGQFVAFNAYLTMLSWPVIAFGWVTNMIQRGMASWKRMLEVLETQPAIADSAGRPFAAADRGAGQGPGSANRAIEEARHTRAIRGEIEFRDLVFSYDGKKVLDRVTLKVEAGQTVALVGPTGSGKSTLINLLPRLADPPRGSVFVDGHDVRDLPLAVLRSSIGFVPQEPFLFSDTLANNVAFGLDAILERAGRAGQAGGAGQAGEERLRPYRAEDMGIQGEVSASVRAGGGAPAPVKDDTRMQRILAAAAVARLDKDVVDFPHGYETRVGERGLTLSGGQKQRTAIARAIVVDPAILVLDDALSAVDTQTEEEILTRLRGVMRSRTSIIVSHRISTVRDADQIFVLDEGRIVERGQHDQLVKQNGLYAALHRKQLLEEELAAS